MAVDRAVLDGALLLQLCGNAGHPTDFNYRYQDYLDQHPGKHRSQAYVLIGGIKNWLATFAGQEDLVDAD